MSAQSRPARRLTTTVAVATSLVVLAGCGSGSSGPTNPPTRTPTPTPTTTQQAVSSFLGYLHGHGIPKGANPQRLIKLGYTFVCASYRYNEKTEEILQIAKEHGLHPKHDVQTLIDASVLYLCPRYQAKAGLRGA